MTTVHEAALRVAKLHARLTYLQTRLGYAQHKLIMAEADLLEHNESGPDENDSMGFGWYRQAERLVTEVDNWKEEIETVMKESASAMDMINETFITE